MNNSLTGSSRPSVVTVMCLLGAVRAVLRLAGISKVLKVAQWFAHRSTERFNAYCDPKSIADRVALAGALFPGRARCLEQSIALYCLLRRRGVNAALRFGVQPYGFVAHAWVEVDGVPLNEE